jgi:hypothetical protein
MVFSTAEQSPDTYHLWKRFSFPTDDGLKDAFAVSVAWGQGITAVYSIMLELVFAYTLYILIAGVIIATNRKSKSASSTKTEKVTKEITEIIVKRELLRPRWLWIIFAISFALAPMVLPSIIAPYLIIGNGAPVVAESIYVPQSDYASKDYIHQMQINNLEKPAALRAIGTVQTAGADMDNVVTVTQPKQLQDLGGGNTVLEIEYNYMLTAADFGLQRFDGLVLNVQGSCYTEYNWIDTTETGTIVDTDYYHPYNDPNTLDVVSTLEGYAPTAHFYFGSGSNIAPNVTNYTYAIIISSMERTSFTVGSDPWYLTSNTPEPASDDVINTPVYLVLRQRPALSCWQTDTWTYQGHNASTYYLDSIPGLNFPVALKNVFFREFGVPKIFYLGQYLGPLSLKSSSQVAFYYFDAASSSMYNDMQRLVLTSYVSIANTLTDSTLYHPDEGYSIPNLVTADNSTDVAIFVVYSSDIATIWMPLIIAIPFLALGLWLVELGVRLWLEPWSKSGRGEVEVMGGDGGSPVSPGMDSGKEGGGYFSKML